MASHLLAGVDKGFLAEQRARAKAREARFAREAANGPPPLPTNRLTVSEGKVHRPREEADVMTAFIRRKLASGTTLDRVVMQKAHALGISVERLEAEVAAEAEAADMVRPTPITARAAQGLRGRGRDAHVSLDDDLDDYFRAAASPPKRDCGHLRAEASSAPIVATAANAGQQPQTQPKPKKQSRPQPQRPQPPRPSQPLPTYTSPTFVHKPHEQKEQPRTRTRQERPLRSSEARAHGDSGGDGRRDGLSAEQARVIEETVRMLMAAGGGSDAAHPTPRGPPAVPNRRWRLVRMLTAHKDLRTSTTRAFFAPLMKRQRRLTKGSKRPKPSAA